MNVSGTLQTVRGPVDPCGRARPLRSPHQLPERGTLRLPAEHRQGTSAESVPCDSRPRQSACRLPEILQHSDGKLHDQSDHAGPGHRAECRKYPPERESGPESISERTFPGPGYGIVRGLSGPLPHQPLCAGTDRPLRLFQSVPGGTRPDRRSGSIFKIEHDRKMIRKLNLRNRKPE